MSLLMCSRGRINEQIVSTLDLSSDGLRIQAPIALTTGQTVEVYTCDGRERVGRYRVVWVAIPGPEKPFEAGLEIVN